MSGVSWPRLAAALVGAALLMTALAAGIAFVIHGFWEISATAVMAQTRQAALVAASAFTVFNLTFGLAATTALLRARRTGLLAFATAGAAAGLAFGLFTAIAFGNPVQPIVLAVLTAAGALMLALIRALAGVRRG